MWGQPFYELIDNPRLVPMLTEIFSDPIYRHQLPGTPPECAVRVHKHPAVCL
jgi:hypothetical protein